MAARLLDGKALAAHSGQIGFGEADQVHVEAGGLIHEIENAAKRMFQRLRHGGCGKSDAHERSSKVKVGHCRRCV